MKKVALITDVEVVALTRLFLPDLFNSRPILFNSPW